MFEDPQTVVAVVLVACGLGVVVAAATWFVVCEWRDVHRPYGLQKLGIVAAGIGLFAAVVGFFLMDSAGVAFLVGVASLLAGVILGLLLAELSRAWDRRD